MDDGVCGWEVGVGCEVRSYKCGVLYLKSNKQYTLEEQLQVFLEDKHQAPFSVMNDMAVEPREWGIARQAYQTEKYYTVINQLEHLGSLTSEQSLYLGLSYLYSSNESLNSAILEFERIAHSSSALNKDEASWFLAISLLKKGDIGRATTILQIIQKEKSWNYTKATLLLQQIQQK